jgi:hypothetical protein
LTYRSDIPEKPFGYLQEASTLSSYSKSIVRLLAFVIRIGCKLMEKGNLSIQLSPEQIILSHEILSSLTAPLTPTPTLTLNETKPSAVHKLLFSLFAVRHRLTLKKIWSCPVTLFICLWNLNGDGGFASADTVLTRMSPLQFCIRLVLYQEIYNRAAAEEEADMMVSVPILLLSSSHQGY